MVLNVNILVSLLSIIVLTMTIVCRKSFKSDELFYLIVIICLIILMASLKEKFDETFFSKNYNIISNRNANFKVKNKECYLRSKEVGDYKESISQRLDNERLMEENNRENMVFKHEMEKLVNMGNENLEYIVNGENF